MSGFIGLTATRRSSGPTRPTTSRSGTPEDEYLGHNITEFHADQDVIGDILTRLLGGQSLYNYKARLLKKDGSTLSVLIASSGLFDGDSFVHTRCFTIADPAAS